MRRGDAHNTVHHSKECRKRIEAEMSKDDLLSKRLVDIEDRKKGVSCETSCNVRS